MEFGIRDDGLDIQLKIKASDMMSSTNELDRHMPS